MTDEQVLRILEAQGKQHAEAMAKLSSDSDARMLVAIEELRKPLPHEQAKIDKEIELEKRKRISKLKESIQYIRKDKAAQFYCKHEKDAVGIMPGGHAFRGQVNSDDCFRAQCIRCNKLFPKIRANSEQLKNGLYLQNIKKGMNAEFLLAQHIKDFPACSDCLAGACAVGDLRQIKQGFLDPEPEVMPDGKIKAEFAVGA